MNQACSRWNLISVANQTKTSELVPMEPHTSRRDFLKTTAAITAGAAANVFAQKLSAKDGGHGVAIILNPEDAKKKPAQWAATELLDSLKAHGTVAEYS